MTAPRQPEPPSEPSEEKRLIGGDASREQIMVIDLATALLDVSRARFVVDAAVEKANSVLAERGVSIPAA